MLFKTGDLVSLFSLSHALGYVGVVTATEIDVFWIDKYYLGPDGSKDVHSYPSDLVLVTSILREPDAL